MTKGRLKQMANFNSLTELPNRKGIYNISKAVGTILDMNIQIATAVEEHGVVVDEVTRSIVAISKISCSNIKLSL